MSYFQNNLNNAKKLLILIKDQLKGLSEADQHFMLEHTIKKINEMLYTTYTCYKEDL